MSYRAPGIKRADNAVIGTEQQNQLKLAVICHRKTTSRNFTVDGVFTTGLSGKRALKYPRVLAQGALLCKRSNYRGFGGSTPLTPSYWQSCWTSETLRTQQVQKQSRIATKLGPGSGIRLKRSDSLRFAQSVEIEGKAERPRACDDRP